MDGTPRKSRRRLIAFVGAMGAGKSTAADYFVNYCGFQKLSFAKPLKDMMRAIPGITEEHINGSLKEIPCDILCGQSPRHAQQTLGTEWGRNQLGELFWVGLFAQQFNATMRDVVCDDCRFPNEAALIQALGGEIWQIRRDEAEEALKLSETDHPSERHWPLFECEGQIHNNRTVYELQRQLERVMQRPYIQ